MAKLHCISETPGHGSGWAETPHTDRAADLIQETPSSAANKRRSRWDETPGATPGGMTPANMTPGGTPGPGATPGGTTPGGDTPHSFSSGNFTPSAKGAAAMFTPSGSTPIGTKAMQMATPTPGWMQFVQVSTEMAIEAISYLVIVLKCGL